MSASRSNPGAFFAPKWHSQLAWNQCEPSIPPFNPAMSRFRRPSYRFEARWRSGGLIGAHPRRRVSTSAARRAPVARAAAPTAWRPILLATCNRWARRARARRTTLLPRGGGSCRLWRLCPHPPPSSPPPPRCRRRRRPCPCRPCRRCNRRCRPRRRPTRPTRRRCRPRPRPSLVTSARGGRNAARIAGARAGSRSPAGVQWTPWHGPCRRYDWPAARCCGFVRSDVGRLAAMRVFGCKNVFLVSWRPFFFSGAAPRRPRAHPRPLRRPKMQF